MPHKSYTIQKTTFQAVFASYSLSAVFLNFFRTDEPVHLLKRALLQSDIINESGTILHLIWRKSPESTAPQVLRTLSTLCVRMIYQPIVNHFFHEDNNFQCSSIDLGGKEGFF